jgi:isovaleryl-CoA dehydrogenase
MSQREADASWAMLDVPLPPAVRALRQEARAFARREILPRAQDIDGSGHIPADLWPKLGQAGMLGVTVAPSYGGAGLGYLEAWPSPSRRPGPMRSAAWRPLPSRRATASR